MIIVLKKNPDPRQLGNFRNWLRSMDFEIHYSHGSSTSLMGLVGDTSSLDIDMIRAIDVVDKAVRIQEPYKRANRKLYPENTVVDVAGAKFGDGNFQIIAGPCSVESEEQLCDIAEDIKLSGATLLRGGLFVPVSSSVSFKQMRKDTFELLEKAKELTGLPIVAEITDVAHLDFFENIDLIHVGARSMFNLELLKGLGSLNKPILLKRGPSATLEELLISAEQILTGGNPNVILCERGIRTFETATKNTLDLSAIPYLKQKTHLPVIVDPSHATGDASLVLPMALAATAAGADGLMIEVHNMPLQTQCDGPQAIDLEEFELLVKKVNTLRECGL